MRAIFNIIPILALVVFFGSCKDPYVPHIKDLDKEILVVEGYIDGANETNIYISRVRSMGKFDTSFQKFVTNAVVYIEDDRGGQYRLQNRGDGSYAGNYRLNPTARYRLYIQTAGNKQYVSAFVDFKESPVIDSISYRIESQGARFFVSTHDNSNRSKFYRWKYEETWEFHSYYPTEFEYDRELRRVVDLRDSIYSCWQFENSTKILVNSTVNQSRDVMENVPLLLIPNGSQKLSYKYSLKVRQFVMDSLGYDYYRQLKTNTEETGSIFDPQPGNLKGNIQNMNDPDEIVVGYIGAGNSAERREFFTIPWNYRNTQCSETITVPGNRDSMDFYFKLLNYWPILESMDGPVTNWLAAPASCVDCRTAGTNVKPAYWP